MSNVVELHPKNDPHMQGEARCLACGHEWQAVAPVGTKVHNIDDSVTMTCPACDASKGVMKHFVQLSWAPSWHCNSCNGFLFSAVLIKSTPTLACASCGNLINALDLFNEPS